jgi:peptidoglycan/LPS O-acetylase OafA/YrhL
VTPLTSSGLRWFFWVAAVLALIAGVELFVGASETDRFFSWTIDPPLTAAFLGAAYWAACVLLAWAGNEREWPRARSALPPVVTIAVLLLVATLIHLDRFHHDLYGRFWLVVYVIVVPLLAYLIWTQPKGSGPPTPPALGLPRWLRAALGLQSAALLVFGVLLFVAPVGMHSIWPWPVTPLTGRAIGAFLCGFGVAAAFAVRENDLDRLHGSALAWGTLGALEVVAVALHGDDLAASDLATAAYLAFFASILGLGAYGALRGRSA